MNDQSHNEMIQRLEQRHEQLLGEIDALNERLEQALDSIIKPTEGLSSVLPAES